MNIKNKKIYRKKLTPSSVLILWSASWAFRAAFRVKNVTKQHPENTQERHHKAYIQQNTEKKQTICKQYIIYYALTQITNRLFTFIIHEYYIEKSKRQFWHIFESVALTKRCGRRAQCTLLHLSGKNNFNNSD